MEECGILNPLDETHIAVLHYVYLQHINRNLDVWRNAWFHHRLRTVGSSPMRLWLSGQMQNPVGIELEEQEIQEYGIEDEETEDIAEDAYARPIYEAPVNEDCIRKLQAEIPLPWTSNNFGIDVYLKGLDIVNNEIYL